MKHMLTLYTGSIEGDAPVQHALRQWISQRKDVVLTVESIHTNPAEALRLRITQLPALVLEDTVIAQGPPEQWLNALFLDQLLAP